MFLKQRVTYFDLYLWVAEITVPKPDLIFVSESFTITMLKETWLDDLSGHFFTRKLLKPVLFKRKVKIRILFTFTAPFQRHEYKICYNLLDVAIVLFILCFCIVTI